MPGWCRLALSVHGDWSLQSKIEKDPQYYFRACMVDEQQQIRENIIFSLLFRTSGSNNIQPVVVVVVVVGGRMYRFMRSLSRSTKGCITLPRLLYKATRILHSLSQTHTAWQAWLIRSHCPIASAKKQKLTSGIVDCEICISHSTTLGSAA